MWREEEDLDYIARKELEEELGEQANSDEENSDAEPQRSSGAFCPWRDSFNVAPSHGSHQGVSVGSSLNNALSSPQYLATQSFRPLVNTVYFKGPLEALASTSRDTVGGAYYLTPQNGQPLQDIARPRQDLHNIAPFYSYHLGASDGFQSTAAPSSSYASSSPHYLPVQNFQPRVNLREGNRPRQNAYNEAPTYRYNPGTSVDFNSISSYSLNRGPQPYNTEPVQMWRPKEVPVNKVLAQRFPAFQPCEMLPSEQSAYTIFHCPVPDCEKQGSLTCIQKHMQSEHF